MGLKSKHFKDNRRLEDCLTEDTAHVPPGDSGEHVSLIQFALRRLAVPGIGDREVENKIYGPGTASAVLKFKKSFNIVNHAYEVAVDNIVGKMTIAELDRQMLGLEGFGGPKRCPNPLAAHPALHPASPAASASLRPAKYFAEPKAHAVGAKSADGESEPPPWSVPDFEGRLANLPMDLQALIRDSNWAKKPGDLMLYPWIANHEGTLSGKELSKRFEDHTPEFEVLQKLHARMQPFLIFASIKLIHNTWADPSSSSGFFVDLEDDERLFQHMRALSDVQPREGGVIDAKFCRDAFNVHGQRDSFRELVPNGPGLHICIPEPAVRGTILSDFHIDATQQGQVCFNGYCVPIVDRRTTEHLRQVGPWLVSQGYEKVLKWGQKFK